MLSSTNIDIIPSLGTLHNKDCQGSKWTDRNLVTKQTIKSENTKHILFAYLKCMILTVYFKQIWSTLVLLKTTDLIWMTQGLNTGVYATELLKLCKDSTVAQLQ